MSLLAETKFGLSLLKQSSVDESYVISPLSISIALALLHSGAEGTTKEQIRKALAGDNSDEVLVEHYKSLGEALLKESSVVVKIANRIFIREGFEVKKSFLDEIGKNYGANAETLDFNNGKATSEAVNGFVDDVTNGKIKEIVQESDFAEAVSIVVNAIYFDAEWKNQFGGEHTQQGQFHVKKGVTKKIPFMINSKVWDGKYAANKDVEVLTMDYKDEDYKFSILLPKQKIFNKFSLSSFRKKLTAEKLQKLLESVKETYVTIVIPKFKIERETDLNKTLEAMGITDIFKETANLEGIAKGVKVSKIKHKAVIEIDEWGTKAAAVTYEPLLGCCLGEPVPIDFRANRPFIYVLTYKNHIIFTGQFCG